MDYTARSMYPKAKRSRPRRWLLRLIRVLITFVAWLLWHIPSDIYMVKFKIALAEFLGFFILLPACILHSWTKPVFPSIKNISQRSLIDSWSWGWLRPWYDNIEDGVSGQQAYIWVNGNLVNYASTFPKWVPKWVIAYQWSALRNGANNIKRPLRNDPWGEG